MFPSPYATQTCDVNAMEDRVERFQWKKITLQPLPYQARQLNLTLKNPGDLSHRKHRNLHFISEQITDTRNLPVIHR